VAEPFPQSTHAIPYYPHDLPYLSNEQMVEVDRAMVEDYHIDLVQMMENAGRNLAALARRRFLANQPQEKRVTVLAGSGGNGGGALVCARRLHTWGAGVTVITARPAADFTPVPAHQLDILKRMGIGIYPAEDKPNEATPDLIIDGIIGYSLTGAPRGGAAALIRWANSQKAPSLALDIPSGIEATSGTPRQPAIQAVATMTLALPKTGLKNPEARKLVGELYLADISVPPSLYAEPALALEVGAIFAANDIVRLW